MKQRGSNPPAQPAHEAPLRAEAVQDASHGRQVPAAKIVRVDQKRVEVVEVAARLEEAVPDRSQLRVAPHERVAERVEEAYEGELDLGVRVVDGRVEEGRDPAPLRQHVPAPDRKSTRLNSSHANISYAVFCLKKKKTRL